MARSDDGGGAAAAGRAGAAAQGLAGRLVAAWRGLQPSQRLPAYACAALVATLFLPWYSKTFAGRLGEGEAGRIDAVTEGVSAWAKFTFVEAGVLLVAVSVLVLLFRRGEGRAFHLPGGDGLVIAVAGGWAAFLCFYRLIDQPATERLENGVVTYGVRWGVFFALVAGVALASSGLRLRAADVAEPPLPGERPRPPRRERVRAPGDEPAPPPADVEAPAADVTRVEPSAQPTRVDAPSQPTRVTPRREGEHADQLSFDEPG